MPQIISESVPSIIKDPFNQKSMTSLSVFCRKDFIEEGWSYQAHVGFENGDTEGEQKFKADSLEGLLIKVRSFIATLEKGSR